MNSLTPKRKHGPEWYIQQDIIAYLRMREWLVKPTHGNKFQSGFPDLFATNAKYGPRWIEVKNADSYKFQPSQLEWFPQFCAHGSGVWVLVAATEAEYKKLLQPYNWWQYIK